MGRSSFSSNTNSNNETLKYLLQIRGVYSMNEDRIAEIKNRIQVKKISKELSEIKGINVIKYPFDDNKNNYQKMIDQIIKIDYPVSYFFDNGKSIYEYVEFGYKQLELQISNIKWLIPYFKKNEFWLEVEIDDLNNFLNYYVDSKNNYCNLSFFDIENHFLMDIELGENCYEYRIIRY